MQYQELKTLCKLKQPENYLKKKDWKFKTELSRGPYVG